MKEEEIRPAALFNQYLALAEQDVFTYFNDAPRQIIPCPACGNESNRPVFRKTGFNYVECNTCKTLFVNPRPDEESFNKYYTDSPSVQFWATHFYKETEKARRELIIRPKAIKVGQLLEKYLKPGITYPVIIDIGAGYGVFCEELAALHKGDCTIMGIEPAPALQEICRQKKLLVIPKFLEDVVPEDLNGGHCAAATSFELLEHLHNPGAFIRSCRSLLDKGGILILTTLSWDGFDLQVLGEKSKSINPPHHINFFTPHSVRLLLEANGFRLLEVTTPGKLDVDIVMKQLPDVRCEFVRRMLLKGDNPTKERFQEFLQNSLMSSHMMIVAERQ
jgi:SAM-dependent methyltransferase